MRTRVRALGKRFDAEVNTETAALYLALHELADHSGVRSAADVAYGGHPLQTFDIAWPEAPGEGRAIVVYLHGGGFVRGDKTTAASGGLIYANVARFFARHGALGINANYRLAPEATWPAGAEDVREILRWVGAHAREYGADPARVYLMGNSAGAAHVATYLFHAPSQFLDGPRVAGALLSSGAFDARGAEAYYGQAGDERAPLALVDGYDGQVPPTFLWCAELDPPFIEQSAVAMHAKLHAKLGDRVRFRQFHGHNHVSHVMSLDTPDDEVGLAVREFVGA